MQTHGIQFPIHFTNLNTMLQFMNNFFYDDLMATILRCTIYSYMIFPAST
jgi:hypothetical protein